MHLALDLRIPNRVTTSQVICPGEADGILNGDDLLLIQMLLYFGVEAVEKHHKDFFLAWVDHQAEPLGKYCNVLFHIV